MYKKILMAYNGTVEGRAGLLACAELAAFVKAQAYLLAVASIPSSLFMTEGFVPEEVIEQEKSRMQAVLEEGLRTLTERGFAVEGHLAVGEPVEEICRLARSLACDLIVVGHKRQQSFAARWWRGSVGASLLDYSPCSILVVTEGS